MNTPAKTIGSYDFARVAEWVTAWHRPLLITHARPDGDAIGALIALRAALRAAGSQPRAILYEPVPPRYHWLLDGDPLDVLTSPTDPALAEADGVLIVDTCTYSQLEPIAEWLQQCSLPKVAVDHHLTRDDLADDYLVDESASAACLIVYEWARAVGWKLDAAARVALYVGISTDTGWFRFANTDARTLEAITRLAASGIEPAMVFERVYQTESAARFRLLGATLAGVELYEDDRLAVMTITRDMFARAGADSTDTDDFINYPLQIGRVNASVLLVEQDDQLVRVSFRSKPPSSDGRPDLDVAKIAAGLGGGGHRRAAGVRLTGTLEEVKQRVIEEMRKVLAT